MKTDVEIAQEAKMLPIYEVAKSLAIEEDDLELYGKYKAKISLGAWNKVKGNKDGKLILVTAINPTPAGEGKTTTSVGLADAFHKMGKKIAVALREPSLGPCFGLKGGAAGGGYAQVVPMEDINLHFTGDFHASTTAHNLLAAVIDNHIQQGNALDIDVRRVAWKRVVDLNDRALRHIVIGMGGKAHGVPRETGFDITVASEMMAILCLASDLEDMKKRLGRIVVAYTRSGRAVVADELNVSYEHYKKIENGNHGCSIALLLDISSFFDVSTDYLLTGRSFETLHIQKQLSAAQDILTGLMKDLK